MREIKFRAWDNYEKKMFFNAQEAYDFIGARQDDGYGFPASCFSDVLDTKAWEVMQYTGLKDKNGKEIYEGDIVKKDLEAFKTYDISIEPIADIHYKDGGFFVGDFARSGVFLGAVHEDVEVIGNIYENPELLKK